MSGLEQLPGLTLLSTAKEYMCALCGIAETPPVCVAACVVDKIKCIVGRDRFSGRT